MLASLVSGLLVIFTQAAAAHQKDLVFCVLSEQERVKCEVRIFQGFQSLNKIVFMMTTRTWHDRLRKTKRMMIEPLAATSGQFDAQTPILAGLKLNPFAFSLKNFSPLLLSESKEPHKNERQK